VPAECTTTRHVQHHAFQDFNTCIPPTGPPTIWYVCCVLQVADALSLQFRLPPPGVPPPLPRSSQDVLGGCPVVDSLLLTSVWAVAALRQLAQVRLLQERLGIGCS
jgi:hypothetical protein